MRHPHPSSSPSDRPALHRLWAGVCAAALLAPPPCRLQTGPDDDDDARTRQLWATAFKKKREAVERPGPPIPSPRPTARVQPAPQPVDPVDALGDSLVGVTIWRLRPAAGPNEMTDRALVFRHKADSFVAERVKPGTRFRAGDRIRIGVESARAGYLYLIDRERYADGSTGEPMLIFPRADIRGGDNRVSAGRVVEVPALSDSPQFFEMEKSRPDHLGDDLIVLLTPEPLPDIPPHPRPLPLPRDRVALWEKGSAAPLQSLEMAGAGALYTRPEHDAGDGTRLLAHDDPLPQTMHRVEAKAGQPGMIRVPLLITKEPAP